MPAASTSDVAMLNRPSSEPFIGSRLPNRMISKKATAGDDRDQPGVLEEPASVATGISEEHQPFISDSSSSEMLLRLR